MSLVLKFKVCISRTNPFRPLSELASCKSIFCLKKHVFGVKISPRARRTSLTPRFFPYRATADSESTKLERVRRVRSV